MPKAPTSALTCYTPQQTRSYFFNICHFIFNMMSRTSGYQKVYLTN